MRSRTSTRLATSPAKRSASIEAFALGLKPLVLALVAAFPVLTEAQAARAGLPPPPAFKVPVPATVPGWRVYGTGAAAPVNTPNKSGGVDQAINQTSQNAIYNWLSFDIGASSSVTFNFPSSASSALNRVTGAAAPSQIFGRLTSQYANPIAGGAPLVGGSIYLINANGILFGRTAQVNTGALIASTLDLTNDDFNAGLTQSITSTAPTFFQNGPGVPDSNNFVALDSGAQITTPDGGRVFLFAKNVANGGTITTPGGQTVLAAGDQVYLNVPTAEITYASEANPSIPALRGLLVEVGTGNGSVVNLAGGTINTPRGNTTLVGMTVNQSGRISATTSVSDNGSVMLLARGSAQALTNPSSGIVSKRATVEGTLTLGSGSSIEIAPDTTPGINGVPVTADSNSVFTTSRVELDGKTVALQSGASIVAHGGIVDIRSESVPYYEEMTNPVLPYNFSAFNGDTGARLLIGQGATIDVSGTTSASVSAARNFVTTALLGASDLKDAPLQKDGPIYRSKLTFDVRSPVAILGDTSSYVAAIQRTATEKLSAGGQINLSSTGAVVTNESSSLNVSGGSVTYSSALVTPSQLISSDGKLYSFNQAPANVRYAGILGGSTPTIDRWGIVPQWAPAQTRTGVVAPGYVDAKAGGTLLVVAPVTVLDGAIAAATGAGVRQTAGLDPLPTPSRVLIGARNNGNFGFGSTDYGTSGLGDLVIGAGPGSLGATFWSSPLDVALPSEGRISASTINASGAGRIVITSDGNITQQAKADIALPAGAVLDLAAAGADGISIGASFTSAGGTFNAQTRDVANSPLHPGSLAGGITLAAGSVLDVAGTWVNRALDGPDTSAASAGGSVTLSSARGLDLQDASRIDMSGGATVAVNGTVSATSSGNLTLQGDAVRSDVAPPSPIHIGAVVSADSLGNGGSFTLSADSITIGSAPLPHGVQDGAAPGSLVLSDAFFDNGAFTAYNINAIDALTVQSGVALRPQASNWILTAAAKNQPSGTPPSQFLSAGLLPDAQREPVSVALTAASRQGNAVGKLSVAQGASIQTDPLGSVTLAAGLDLQMDGSVTAHGGNVSVGLVGSAQSNTQRGELDLGSSASIDVSGQTIFDLQTGAIPTGRMLAGGNVTLGVSLSAALTPIVLQAGSSIAADGGTAVLGVNTTTSSGAATLILQSVASPGGTITIGSQAGGSVLAGSLHALGGDKSASAGTFVLTETAGSIVVQQAPVTARDPIAETVSVSSSALSAGFANVTLQAQGAIRFTGDVSLAVAGNLLLDAPVIAASPESRAVSLSGASTIQVGSSYQLTPSGAGAIGGGAAFTLQGGLVDLFGQQAVQGAKSVDVVSSHEIRLASLTGVAGLQGGLSIQADLTLDAPQISPTTNSQYVIDAAGQRVLLTGGDSSTVAPLSAGGAVTINARDITTINPTNAGGYAVVRAPFGSLTFNASERIDIGAGSLLSVSGAGLTVPFGTTTGGQGWAYDNSSVQAPVAKTISLNAPGQAVNVATGAKVDLSGGGDLIAQEFVPGIGGSKDIFAGAAGGSFAVVPSITAYAPQDADILGLTDASGQKASAMPGLQITFGAGGPLPAGTYAVLPARYATLPGAFLITPVASTAPLALGVALAQTDGTTLQGGRYGEAGTTFASALPQSFVVQTSALARTHSEIDQTNANAYFASVATAAGQSVPPLPTDAGRLDIVADQLNLKGTTAFSLPTSSDASGKTTTTGRGGELDISASAIDVSNGQAAIPGVLSLSAEDLNATGASLLVLGGQRSGSADGALNVTSRSVMVDNAGTPLRINDLVLAATGSVQLKAGADIEAPSAPATGLATPAPTLAVTGDGALLRVSSDPSASSTRTGAQRLAGTLDIGAGATISGGAIIAEATSSNVIAGDASIGASAITLGASRIAIGGDGGATTLTITPTLAAQIGAAQSLTLRSFDGLDLYGSVAFGGTALRSLTLDAGTIHLVGSGETATLQAGGITLTNSSGSSATATTDGGNTLQLTAGANVAGLGTGQIQLGAGQIAIAGAKTVTLTAANEVVLHDGADFAAAGDLTVNATALQAATGAAATVQALGTFRLDAGASPPSSTSANAGLGAHIEIDGASIVQAGHIVLPSGQLTMNASGGTSSTPAIQFSSGSLTDLSGRSSSFDGVTVSTSGGSLAISAPAGDFTLSSGAAVDVSGAAAGGQAGSVAISAPTGSVRLQGTLRGAAAAGQGGGSLAVDSGTALNLASLAAMLDVAPDNFGESLDLRNRSGDQQFTTGSAALSARHISISADTGHLSIGAQLDASGASGTTIALAGGGGLEIGSGAQLSAHSTGAVGGQVSLSSGNLQLQTDGTFSGSNGPVHFDAGTIDTTATSGGANGSVLVRAQRNAAGTDVAVGGAGHTVVLGTSDIEVAAVRQYGATTVDPALIAKINSDNATLGGASGSNASVVTSRLATLLGQSAGSVQLRSGVEVDSLGDLTVTGNSAAGGWNLTQFSASGKAIAQPSGAPMDLTLRARGNLNVAASISDGFLPSGVVPSTSAAASRIVPGAVVATIDGAYADSARMRLVGGADLGAADTIKTVASTVGGDVTIGAAGKTVLVRGTTGDIDVASGRDVVLLNRQAAVYTTGTPATDLDGYVGNKLNAGAYLASGSTPQTPFLSNGGSLSVTAGRDIVGVTPSAASLPQFASEWNWRALDLSTASAQPMWWSRYDQFQQGFATFGGGNVSAMAHRDLVDAEFSAASGGYVARDGSGKPAGARQFGGGDLSVHAGRDAVGGFVLAAGTSGQVEAGRSIVAGADGFGLQLLYGNTAVSVGAQNGLDLGIATSFGLVPATKEYLGKPLPFYLLGLTPSASLQVISSAGDLTYQAVARTDSGNVTAQPKMTSSSSDLQDKIIPDVSLFAAPNGNLTLGQTLQQPAGTTSLDAFAGSNLTIAAITVNGTDPRSATPSTIDDSVVGSLGRLSAAVPAVAPFDAGTRTPMRLVAQSGDLVIGQGIATTTPLRAIAGRDISLGPDSAMWLGATIQHQTGDEVSLVEAGRDILFPDSGTPRLADLQFYGPGNLVVLAGRNIDLSTSGGIEAIGNRQNPALPATSGNITVLAGVSLGSGDYAQAVAWFFPLLGGTGIAGHAGDLQAQLAAFAAGQPLPAIGSAAAIAFSALPVDSQVAQTKSLVSEATFDAAVLADARRRDANRALPLAQALAEFATLTDTDKGAVVGAALAAAWTTTLSPTQQQQVALAMAQSPGAGNASYLAALQQFVVSQGVMSAPTGGAALSAFQALAPERQLLFTNQVLTSEIRKAGRTASALAGADRDAAYAPAYAALDVVFPQVGAPGNLSMGSSQIHTLQDSDINILAPRGSVDVGTLVAGQNQKAANSLGIVTGAGGDISVVVDDSVNVNQSRVFTVGKGDLLMWASNGSLDAGRGAKTVTGAPPPVFSLDATGHFIIDTSGSFSGSGIAVLDPSSTLDLYAPKGEINAGDAGIKSLGNAFFGAARFVGADNLSVGGSAVGAPPAASTGGATAGLAAIGQAAAAAGTQINTDDSDEEKARKRRRRLNLILDFLGFGDGALKDGATKP